MGRDRPDGFHPQGDNARAPKYLHQGELMTLPAGATRVSVTEQLTGWSSGSADDLLALSFRFQNDNTDASELYVVRVGVQFSDWGGSWLSQPK